VKHIAVLAGVACVLGAAAAALSAPSTAAIEVVATGVPRPLQIVLDGRSLVVLSPGRRGDSAGELYQIPLDGELPVDLSRQPRVRIPFADERLATIGSLAINQKTRELLLGEENGTRVYRLAPGEPLSLYATGLKRLAGGSALAFDRLGRLVIVDYADAVLSPGEDRPPPGLEQFREEDYRGPLVFRLDLEAHIPLPRRLEWQAPLFPRAWGSRTGGGMLPRLISVVPVGGSDLILLTSSGDLYRLGADGSFSLFTRLPRAQYNRIHMIAAPDGTIFVSGGFHVGRVFRVSPDGAVAVVASNLADPEGIALDDSGHLYVAESSYHRIVRLRPF